MSSHLAILAGNGSLPLQLSAAFPEALCVVFEGMPHQMGSDRPHCCQFEKLNSLFELLSRNNVKQVVMVGAMSRPKLDPAELDPFMQNIAKDFMQVLQKGDDKVLRYVIKLFEEKGFEVVAPQDLCPDLTLPSGFRSGDLSALSAGDLSFADDILRHMSPLDIGQAVVVEHGHVLGVETLQGTAALLEFVQRTAPHLRMSQGGLLVKRPKTGQDMRVDVPTIGPETIHQVVNAGLSGIVVSPNKVIVLEREKTLSLAKNLGVLLWAQEPQS